MTSDGQKGMVAKEVLGCAHTHSHASASVPTRQSDHASDQAPASLKARIQLKKRIQNPGQSSERTVRSAQGSARLQVLEQPLGLLGLAWLIYWHPSSPG